MKQYIDKDALVAEIDKQKIGYNTDGNHSVEYDTTRKILNVINTLEVKEVDLEKEVEAYMNVHSLHTQDGGRIVFENGDTPNFWCDFRDIAEHFFELGLKAQKGE